MAMPLLFLELKRLDIRLNLIKYKHVNPKL